MHNAAHQASLLTLLKRLEAQNVWRMGYNLWPGSDAQQSQQHQTAALSTSAAVAAAAAAAVQPSPLALVQHHHHLQTLPHLPTLSSPLSQQLQLQAVAQALHAAQPNAAAVASAAFHSAAVRAVAASPVDASTAEAPEWFDDHTVNAQQAMKLLVHRIQQEGPVKQRHLQKLYERCTTGDELDKALKLTRLNYLARGELHQHKPFSHKTSQALVHQALTVGAPEVAQHALKNADMFGLPHDSHKEFHPLLIYYSKQGQLDKMFEAYQFMQSHGKRPGPETCYILVKGCVDQGRPDLGELLIQEFESNGVRVRDGTKKYLLQRSSSGTAAAQAGVATM